MKVKHLVVAFLCMLGCCACSSPKTEVKSPDGHIKMTLTVDENGTPFYNVSVNDSLLIENSKMGFVEGNGVILGGGFRIEKTTAKMKHGRSRGEKIKPTGTIIMKWLSI